MTSALLVSSAATPAPCRPSAPSAASALTRPAAAASALPAASGVVSSRDTASRDRFTRLATRRGTRRSQHRRCRRLLAQAAQQHQSVRGGAFRAVAERRCEHQKIAVTSRELGAPALELLEAEHAHARLRAQHVEVVTQPLPAARLVLDDDDPRGRCGAPRLHCCTLKRTRTRTRWLTFCPPRTGGW